MTDTPDKPAEPELELPPGMPADPSESFKPMPTGEPSEAAYRATVMLGGEAEKEESGVRMSTAAFMLRREVSEGEYGEVWEAVQLTLNRVVAVKRPRPVRGESGGGRQDISELMFKREALIAGQLDHPNIVPVYDLMEDTEGRPLLAMKMVEGQLWSERLEEDDSADLEERLARHLPILLKVCSALAFAHAKGIIHRDLKPSQVMLGRFGEVFVLDWSLAVSVAPGTGTESVTATLVDLAQEMAGPAGTPAYMAPEQALGDPAGLGPWTDIYLLGGILYAILTNECPHPGDEAEDAMLHAREREVEGPRQRTPGRGVPEDLHDLCVRALARDRGLRPATVQEFGAALESHLTGSGRRAESRKLVEEAAGAFAAHQSGYAALEEADSLLVRARNLWADNPEALRLHEKVIEAHALEALRQNDRRLAEMEARRVQNAELRESLLARVARADAEARRREVQRRVAIGGSLVLLLCVVLVGMAGARAGARAREARAAGDALAAQARALDLARELRESMQGFDAWTGRFIPLSYVTSEDKDFVSAQLARDTRLLQTYETTQTALNTMREQIREAGLEPDPPSYRELMAAGTIALAKAYGTTNTETAVQFYRAAMERESWHTATWRALGVALGRGGRLAESVEAFARQEEEVPSGTPLDMSYWEHAMARRSAWNDFVIPAGDTAILASNASRDAGQLSIVRGSWQLLTDTGGWVGLVPGVRARGRSDYLQFDFFGPYIVTSADYPAMARFTPGLSEPRECEVYAAWPVGANATPVHFVVIAESGETTVSVTQDGFGELGLGNGAYWVHLGRHKIGAGPGFGVEVRVEPTVRPVHPQRRGEVFVEAVLFAAKELPAGMTMKPVLSAAPGDADYSLLSVGDAPEISWIRDLGAAQEQARTSGSRLLVYASYPISASMQHPARRESDYCENRLFKSDAVKAVVGQNYVPVWLDLSIDAEAAKQMDIDLAGTSLSVHSPVPQRLDLLKGQQLLLSPVELATRLRRMAQ